MAGFMSGSFGECDDKSDEQAAGESTRPNHTSAPANGALVGPEQKNQAGPQALSEAVCLSRPAPCDELSEDFMARAPAPLKSKGLFKRKFIFLLQKTQGHVMLDYLDRKDARFGISLLQLAKWAAMANRSPRLP
ncbi:MAG TPA: hypothetical protein VLV49_12380 [Terriglobales bacterium]|nr:hypothetical protein [Terriglobales bacterium]